MFLFLSLSQPVLAINIEERRFFNFWNFFDIFFGIFLPESRKNEIRNWNFFLSFSVYIIPFWLKIMPKRVFLIFWNYLLFFSKFSSPVRVWTEFGTKIFSFFLSLSRPRLYWNSIGMMFFSFLNFLAIFLEMAARLGWERNSGLKFFSLFPGLSQPVLDRSNAGIKFLNFWIFLLFLLEFYTSGWVRTELVAKIFFSLSRPIPSRFG